MLKNRFFSMVAAAALVTAAACGGAEETEVETMDPGADAVIVPPTTTAPVVDPAAAPMDTMGMTAPMGTDPAMGTMTDTSAMMAPTTTP